MKPNPLVLIIDNDKANRRLLRQLLQASDYRLIERQTAKEGISAAKNHQPDLIILEWLLPSMGGMAALERIRRLSDSAVLILSVSNREGDVIAALDGGANAYMSRPFAESELLARLRLLQRHPPGELYEPVVTEGNLTVDLTKHAVTIDGTKVDLTRTEQAVLHVLAYNAGRVVSVRQLLRSIWGAEGERHKHDLRVFMSAIRKKMEPMKLEVVIETIDRLGYRLSLRSFADACPFIEQINPVGLLS